MLEEGIISRVDNTEWLIHMVLQNKKIGDLIIYVDFMELNKTSKYDPFPTLFNEETLENIAENKVYSLTNGFFGYHQVQITKEH